MFTPGFNFSEAENTITFDLDCSQKKAPIIIFNKNDYDFDSYDRVLTDPLSKNKKFQK